MNAWPRQPRRGRRPYWWLVLKLIGHLGASALIFVALIGFEWVASYAYYLMDSYHSFPVEMTRVIPKLRIGWFYLDIVLSGIVLLAGLGRFVRDLLEG
jgi:hypothetical protein